MGKCWTLLVRKAETKEEEKVVPQIRRSLRLIHVDSNRCSKHAASKVISDRFSNYYRIFSSSWN